MVNRLAVLLAALLVAASSSAQLTREPSNAMAPEYGPAKGTLLIVGGGPTNNTGIIEKFIQLAGGPDANFVIVPTAGGNRSADGKIRVYKEDDVVGSWRKRGLKNVTMLHTHDPKIADTEEFARPLKDANAVWFDGGRQWNIVDSYANTLTYKAFHKVLERGGVIGGSSAGATIQGAYLVRGAVAGPDIMMTTEPEHQQGFAFLRRSRSTSTSTRESDGTISSRSSRNIPTTRNRTVGEHSDHRDGRPIRSDWSVESSGTRQHAAISTLGKALLRFVARRRLQYENQKNREVWQRDAGAAPEPGQIRGAQEEPQPLS